MGLASEAPLVLIPAASATLVGMLEQVARLAADWFCRNLRAASG